MIAETIERKVYTGPDTRCCAEGCTKLVTTERRLEVRWLMRKSRDSYECENVKFRTTLLVCDEHAMNKFKS